MLNILIKKNVIIIIQVGDRLKRPRLAETMKLIAQYNASIFYNGSMGEKIVKEIQSLGGIMDMDDLRNYRYYHESIN